ncbi:MAG: M1 family metallopeptidase [Acidimicrobiaceae bacterium]|nr:M1 family metallopeptidase [Acidimicrobiaceae bacterium]
MSPRLPAGVVPRHYAIELSPDLDAATFAGAVAVDIDVEERSAAIVMNAAELSIVSARLDTADAEALELDFALDAEAERLTLSRRDGGEFAPGSARLAIAFDGVLNDQLHGFYRSTYTDDGGASHTIATTQFESTDARRAFPCFDEPALKATFATTLIVEDGLLAVSNTAETGREPMEDGRVRVSFATTMPMSTYLVAFVVGPLEVTEAIDCGGVPVRVVHRPGRGDQTGFALDVAAHALEWFSDYYGLPYPSDKLDLVAIPDFAFGAMENLGCVTFREVLLLVDPGAASQPELQQVAKVINHELAHMWFGDLVTMAWWEGIWLNEAFATFMETACSDAYRPGWQIWSTFCRSRASALSTDALASTRPVEYPVHSPAEAEDMFDVITYEKGAALVRMLEQYVGAETFRAGVRLYLRRHAYANTVTEDLWNSLADASGEPVGQIMDGWIHQGGYPAVTATATDHGLRVSQRHFTLDPERADERSWVVPLRLRVRPTAGNPDEMRFLLDRSPRTLTGAAGDPVTVNSGASGFYRDDPGPEALAAVASEGPGDRNAEERHGLVDDAWAATLAGCLDAPAYLDFVLGGFVDERDLTVWQAIAGTLAHLRRLLDADAAQRFCELVVAASDDAAADLGLDPPAGGEDERTGELRATLLRLRGAVADHTATIEACRQRLDHPDPTLAAAALSVVAAHGDAEDFSWVRGRFETASDPQTEQRHLAALADFGDPELVRTILEGTLDGSVRTQDGPYLVRRALLNHVCGSEAWDFLAEHWDRLLGIFPTNYSLARMLEGVTALDRVELAARVHAFLAEHPLPQGAKQVAQHLERLDINVAMRERESGRLAAAILRS